jgi:hypothetical protein
VGWDIAGDKIAAATNIAGAFFMLGLRASKDRNYRFANILQNRWAIL